MNGQQEFIIKKKPIDDEGPVSKKVARNQKKNLNKTLANSKMIQEIQQKKLETKKQSGTSKDSGSSKKGKLDPKVQKKLNDIKAILQHHREQTILRVLEKHNYDQQEALEQLFGLPMDQEPGQKVEAPKFQTQQSTKKQKKKKQTKQQIANEILNQMYENEQEIDPSQFEQLFAQIASIIKEEEKNNGMALFQINQFIDDCYLIKNFILEDQTEIYLDEDDQLCRQTEIFMQELIKNRVALQIKRQQQFPTLGAVNQHSTNKKGTIQIIQDQYKEQKKKQDFFTPSKVPQVHNYNHQYNHNSVYSVNNDPSSYQDILQLSKEYNDMGIDKLKLIYIRLHDINLCKSFLDRYYPEKKKAAKVEKFQDKKVSKESAVKYKFQKPSYKRLEDQNFKHYSLKEIRDQLDHLFKIRTMFRMTKGKTTNVAHKKELDRLARRDDSRIEKLIQVARFKAVEEMVRSNLQFIDLHGYREEEIDELFDQIEDMIRLEFKKGNSRLETTKSGSNVYCVVKALTGKGLHSKYNKSVLKPALLDWCARNGAKSTESDDSINVFIEVR